MEFMVELNSGKSGVVSSVVAKALTKATPTTFNQTMKTIENKVDDRQKVRILSPKDLTISHFCGSGAGGQARNKVHSGVQIKHEESGAIGRASDSRSEADNKVSAFNRLLKDPRMKFWIAKKVYEIRQGETIEQTVDALMTPSNIKYEIKNAVGQWEEVNEAYFESAAAKELSNP